MPVVALTVEVKLTKVDDLTESAYEEFSALSEEEQKAAVQGFLEDDLDCIVEINSLSHTVAEKRD
jgi:hypothetical protein